MGQDNGRVDADPSMRWNGWGDPAKAKDLPLAVRSLLPLLLGRIRKPEPSVELSAVRVAASALTDADLTAFRAAVGLQNVDDSDHARIRHAGGRSTPDLL